MDELFNWHNYNAQTLLSDPILKDRFKTLLTKVDRVVVHEDFAGMGTAGVALVQQLQAFSAVLAADQNHHDGDSTIVLAVQVMMMFSIPITHVFSTQGSC